MEREPAYQAVAANLGGSTPRELFEDVLEELEGVYAQQCTVLRDAVQALGVEASLRDMADGAALRAALLGMAEGDNKGQLEALPALPLYDLSMCLIAHMLITLCTVHTPYLHCCEHTALRVCSAYDCCFLSDVLLEEARGLEEERVAKEARRARRAAEAFSAMLRHHKALGADTTWEEVQSLLSNEPEWQEVADDDERKALFEETVARLQARQKERNKRKV